MKQGAIGVFLHLQYKQSSKGNNIKWTRHFYTEDLIPFLPFEVLILDFNIGTNKAIYM